MIIMTNVITMTSITIMTNLIIITTTIIVFLIRLRVWCSRYDNERSIYGEQKSIQESDRDLSTSRCPTLQYINTQIHKYTNTQICVKYTDGKQEGSLHIKVSSPAMQC